jgi:hypothetical protein
MGRNLLMRRNDSSQAFRSLDYDLFYLDLGIDKVFGYND